MRIRKPFVNKTNGTTSLADQGSNGKGSAESLDSSVTFDLGEGKTITYEVPRARTTPYAITGKVPVEIRLGPIPIRFHVEILPPKGFGVSSP